MPSVNFFHFLFCTAFQFGLKHGILFRACMISDDKPKIYYSFSESHSGRHAGEESAGSAPWGYPSHPGGVEPGIRFGAYELIQIALAVVVLTISFAIVFSRSALLNNGDFWSFRMSAFLAALPVAFVAVITGFMLHELAHKFTAMHYGMWSEFRASGSGLIMTFVLSLIAGIVFAAPGAVVIFGRPNKKENGIISAAGPLTNIGIAGIAVLAMPFAGSLYFVFYCLAFINAFLALFNLLPIPPLDGSKVAKWNVGVYVLMLAVSGFMVYTLW